VHFFCKKKTFFQIKTPPLVFVMKKAAQTLDFHGAQTSVMCKQREKEKTKKRL
jgi:hypothetical protein